MRHTRTLVAILAIILLAVIFAGCGGGGGGGSKKSVKGTARINSASEHPRIGLLKLDDADRFYSVTTNSIELSSLGWQYKPWTVGLPGESANEIYAPCVFNDRDNDKKFDEIEYLGFPVTISGDYIFLVHRSSDGLWAETIFGSAASTLDMKLENQLLCS